MVMKYWRGDKQTELGKRDKHWTLILNTALVRLASEKMSRPSKKIVVRAKIFGCDDEIKSRSVDQRSCIQIWRFQCSDELYLLYFGRLMRYEMRELINWADPEAIRRNLPDCFRKYYPKGNH